MALREMNLTKITDENAFLAPTAKKEAPRKRGALGEIGNRVARQQGAQIGKFVTSKPMTSKPMTTKPILNKTMVTKPLVTRTTLNKPMVNLKNITAKVVTRHTNAPLKASVKLNSFARKPCSTTAEPAAIDAPTEEVEPQQANVENEPESAYSAELLPVASLDEDDDPTLVAIYVADIYKYLMDLETKYTIRPDYLAGQEISKRMRGVLIDWLIEVHGQFRLLQESLYLTVAIIDRFLQDYTMIDRKSLQLVGIAAMSVACKYEEMYSPEMGDFVYITDNAYTKNQILVMEGKILKTLGFNFGRPLPLHFLRRFSKVSDATASAHTLAKYFLELSLTEYSMCHLAPSVVAAASVYLSLWMLGGYDTSVWTRVLEQVSTYSLTDIKPVVHQLSVIIVNSSKCSRQATRQKFASSKFMSISCRPELQSEELQNLAHGEGDF